MMRMTIEITMNVMATTINTLSRMTRVMPTLTMKLTVTIKRPNNSNDVDDDIWPQYKIVALKRQCNDVGDDNNKTYKLFNYINKMQLVRFPVLRC